MRFRLYFDGSLPANGRPSQKATIRKALSKQLEILWSQQPLNEIRKYTDPDYRPNDCYVGETVGKTTYFPIITSKLWTIAEIDILLLRGGEPGSIARNGGDIDNQLKTLLDALSVPTATFPNCDPGGQLYCLLQDDKLITRLSVETDRLLRSDLGPNEVVLILGVHVLASSGRNCNIGITL